MGVMISAASSGFNDKLGQSCTVKEIHRMNVFPKIRSRTYMDQFTTRMKALHVCWGRRVQNDIFVSIYLISIFGVGGGKPLDLKMEVFELKIVFHTSCRSLIMDGGDS